MFIWPLATSAEDQDKMDRRFGSSRNMYSNGRQKKENPQFEYIRWNVGAVETSSS